MVHVRETRASACEIKFPIPAGVAPGLIDWARQHLGPDPHGLGPSGDEYHTTTLYFDTPGLDVFHRRGSFGRAKYRVRRYNRADAAFLERKLRKPGVLIKRRTMVRLGDAGCLAGPDRPHETGADWFYERLRVRSLEPVCQVSYDRLARQVQTAEGIARLTLDRRLGAAPIDTPCFRSTAGVPFAEDVIILELKYRVHLPAVFRRLIEEFALQTATASKYRLGMAALGVEAAEDGRLAAASGHQPYA